MMSDQRVWFLEGYSGYHSVFYRSFHPLLVVKGVGASWANVDVA